MKSFGEYLVESQQKTYDFKIKIALRVTDEVVSHIESALKAVDLTNIGKPKFIPIQTHREFPSFGPVEASLLDVSVSFPVNEVQIKSLITERAFIDGSRVFVYPKGQFEIGDAISPDVAEAPDYKPLLTKELEDGESAQEQVGDKKVSSFLKDLQSRKVDIEGEKTPKAKTTNELPQGNTSPFSKVKRK